jgi:Uri superfamily endonuclease
MNRSNNLSSLPKRSKAQNNAAKGAYVLVLWLAHAKDVTVGKLGTISFAHGFYAYVGSAMGPAGFKRVTRHLDVSARRRKVQKWHIDYLLAVSEVIGTIEITTNDRIECRIAQSLQQNPLLASIRGFGSSDCTCCSHLFYSRRLEDFESATHKLVCDHYLETPCVAVTVEGCEGCYSGRCESRLANVIRWTS